VAAARSGPSPEPRRQGRGAHQAPDLRRRAPAPGTRVAAGTSSPQELGISRVPGARGRSSASSVRAGCRSSCTAEPSCTGFDEATLRDHYELLRTRPSASPRGGRSSASTTDALAARLTTLAKQLGKVKEPTDFSQITVDFHDTVLRASTSPPVGQAAAARLSQMVPGDFFSLVPPRDGRRAPAACPGSRRPIAARDGDAADAEYRRVMALRSVTMSSRCSLPAGLLAAPQERANRGAEGSELETGRGPFWFAHGSRPPGWSARRRLPVRPVDDEGVAGDEPRVGRREETWPPHPELAQPADTQRRLAVVLVVGPGRGCP